MCTVTFIRVKDSFFLTSSRDEKVHRNNALPPKIYQLKEGCLLFPKDADAGGTWIVVKDHSSAAVLLNGAFTRHQLQSPYRRSRGLILIDILAEKDPADFFLQMNLEAIEPFTVILLQEFVLYECRWDGDKKYKIQLNTGQNHIWSSATLYDKTAQSKREDWFIQWLGGNPQPSQADIFHFHQFAGEGDEQNDIRMNRDGQLFTVSITGIQLDKQTAVMKYLDLKNGITYSQKLNQIAAYAE
ncbi:MAG: NRDE family protein [Ferruginibacter sp.]|nr:NRDE family protein [Ferruginibacter sp.]